MGLLLVLIEAVALSADAFADGVIVKKGKKVFHKFVL